MSELDSKLAVAVNEKRIFDVAKALRDGASPDAVYKGKGMIHIAAEKNYYVILKLLILHNVSLEKTMSTDTEDDLTALHVAVIHDHRDIVCLLTKAGADLNKETKNGQTPLDIAREKDHCVHHLENIENLFNNVASGKVPYGISDIDITLFRDSDQKTLVHIAAEKGLNGSYFDQFLLEDETMLCLKDKNGWTPLHLAASNGHVNTVRFLLRTGAELSPSVIEIAHESVVPYLKNHATELLKEAAFDLNLDGVKQALANGANGSPCLLEAVSEHNRAVTSLLIEAGVDPNQVDKNGNTALHIFLLHDRHFMSFLMSQAMKSLLDKVDSSILNKNGKTALDLALARRSTDAVLVFLEAGWRDYDNEKFQILALHYASKQGLMNDVSILISKGVPVNVKDKFDKTALHLSCERGHSDVANALIKAKADVNCQDKSGKTPVHYAAENGHKNIIKILIDNGCDLNIKDKTGRMPMNSCYANDWTEALQLIQTSGGEFNYDMLILDSAAKNDVEMFELALSKTSDINCKNIRKKTALHFAAATGNEKFVKLLLSKGADPNRMDEGLWTPLHYAGVNNHIKIVQLLAELDVDVNCQIELNGKSTLHLAVEEGNVEVTEYLLTMKKINPNIKDYYDRTPLHYAVINNNLAIIELLMKHGECKAQDSWKMTPLHHAVDGGHCELVKMLIQDESDLEITDIYDRTPFHLAVIKRKRDIISYFIERKGKSKTDANEESLKFIEALRDSKKPSLVHGSFRVDYITGELYTPLQYAAINGYYDVAEFFLKFSQNVDTQTEFLGSTALHMAAEGGHTDIVKLLIDIGEADPNKRNSIRDTPIEAAVIYYFPDTVKYLMDCTKKLEVAVYRAIAYGHKDLIELLDPDRDYLNHPDNIYRAVGSGNLEIMSLFKDMDKSLVREDIDYFGYGVSGVMHSPLHYAARLGHTDIARILIERGICDVNGAYGKKSVDDKSLEEEWSEKDDQEIQGDCRTPLHFAAMFGHFSIAKLLLENGANVKALDATEQTPLHLTKDEALYRLLLHYERNVEPDPTKNTSLHIAVSLNDIKTVTALVGTSPLSKDSAEQTPLHYAARQGSVKIMEILMSRISFYDDVDNAGRTALHYAAESCSYDIIVMLMNQGASKNVEDKDGSTPLNISYRKQDIQSLEFLLANGCVFNFTALLYDSAGLGDKNRFTEAIAAGAVVDDEYTSVFHAAAQNGHIEIVTHIIDTFNVDINATSGEEDMTALHYAAAGNHINVMELLIEKGADKSCKDKSNRTILHYAAKENHQSIVMTFNISTGNKDIDGKTPLHVAAEHGYCDVVNALIDKGAAVNSQDLSSSTPLHYAVQNNHKDVVRVLLERKATPFCKDEVGKIPAYYAAEAGYIDILQVFIENKFDIHSIVKRKPGTQIEVIKGNTIIDDTLEMTWSTLHSAAYAGDLDTVKFLLSKGAKYNYKKFEMTPVHSAAMGGHYEVIRFLCDKGANPDSVDEMGCTPMHYACQQCHLPMVEYLLNICKVDPVPKNKNGRIPMQMLTFSSTIANREDKPQIYGLFAPYIREAFPLDNFSKVFICGSNRVGKSSLNEVLKIRSGRLPNYSYNPQEKVSESIFKLGIKSNSISSPEIGNVVLYDFVSHTDNVYQSLQLGSPAVFIVIINIKKETDVAKRELYYWFEFISVMTSKLTRSSRVIVVGSRADELPDRIRDIEEKSFAAIVKDIAGECLSEKQNFECFVAVDCHRPGGNGIPRLVYKLSESCRNVVVQSDNISYECHIFHVFLTGLEKPVISVNDICSKIQANCRDLLPYSTAAVMRNLKTLHDKGMIMFIEKSEGTGGWAIVNKEALLERFIDVLLLPQSYARKQGISSNTGVIPMSSLQKLFPLYSSEMIKKFLLTFELCHLINIEDLKRMSTNIAPDFAIKPGQPVCSINIISYKEPSVETGDVLFVPSLINNDRPEPDFMSQKPKYNFGWCLYCSNPHKFFSASFFRLLLLQLAFSPLLQKRDKKSYNRKCDIWLNGIYWKTDKIEVLAELSENRYITLLMNVSNFMSQMVCSSIIKKVRSLQRNLSPCEVEECIITPKQLASWEDNVPPDKREYIHIEKIAKAMILQENTVPDIKNKTKVPLEEVLSVHEPYLAIAPVLIKDLFDEEKSNENLNPAHRLHLLSVCSDIMEPLAKDTFTYQKARETLNKFTIFFKNPLELAESCLTSAPDTDENEEEYSDDDDDDDEEDEDYKLYANLSAGQTDSERAKLDKILSKTLASSIEDSKPTFQKLFKLLSEIAYRWEILGGFLGVSSSVLGELAEQPGRDPKPKLNRVLQCWLNKETSFPTWREVIDVLDNHMGNGDIAHNVRCSLGIKKT